VTGYAIAMSPCIGCGRLFGYNPLRVPSLTWKGTREPICQDCVTRINPRRIANGLPPIVPADDAYEPVAESELP
jgi:hypothetical protein